MNRALTAALLFAGAVPLSGSAAAQCPPSGSDLRVVASRYDALLGESRLLLRSIEHPKAPPRLVSCDLAQGQGSATSQIPAQPPPVLVETRRLAQLYLHSANSSALLNVRPLRRGRLGDVIPVSLRALHGKTLTARVTGPDRLEAVF